MKIINDNKSKDEMINNLNSLMEGLKLSKGNDSESEQ